ncbi:MAG: hypothetical protein R2822_24070 [Spirosomataceae bacterium]
MKKFISSILTITLLGTTVSVAQRASVDSPHNYKRPVSQKTKSATTEERIDRVAPLKLQNNVMSVHNYKRQGSTSFAQESIVAVNVPPLNVQPLNPLLIQHHYKGHFEPIKVEQRAAKINKITESKEKLAAN